MSSGVFKGNASGTGVVTLETPNTNTDITIALPARAGNLMMDGPAFSASQTTQQSISSGTNTKVQFQTKAFDTANCFSTSTYRFTPNVAGYYQVNGAVAFTNFISPATIVQLSKNGSEFFRGQRVNTATSEQVTVVMSCLLYLNGSTDYIELYCYQGSGSSQNIENNPAGTNTWFNAALVRGA